MDEVDGMSKELKNREPKSFIQIKLGVHDFIGLKSHKISIGMEEFHFILHTTNKTTWN
jgi:hypothetical protein